MKKIKLYERQKDILQRLVKELSQKTERDYQIVFKDFIIELQYDNKGTIIPVHSFIKMADDDRPEVQAYYYLRGAIEN